MTDFPKENLPRILGALGKFPWKRQKERKIPHDSSRGSMGYDNLIKWLSQSQNSEMYQNVEITCWIRAVFFLAPNSDKTGLKILQNNSILRAALNIFTFNRFKSTLWDTQKFLYITVVSQELFP